LKEHIQRQMGEEKARHSIRRKKGIGTVVGTVVSLAIIAFILINIMVWTSNVGAQMRQFDTQGLEEKISILDVSFLPQQILFTLKNTGSRRVHIVSLWVVNFTAPTNHSRYTLDLYISAGETTTYTLNCRWRSGNNLLFKFITELGRIFSIYKQAIGTAYPSNYAMIKGSYVSGNLPTDVQTVDSAYFTTKTEATAFKTNACIAYRSNTGTNTLSSPKFRAWNGSTWDASETELATAGSTVRWVRVAYCPISSRSYEKIVVTLSDDGYLDAYVWTGSSWSVTNNIGSAGTTANSYRCFDIAYEKTSGKALLVYSRGTTTNEIGYKTWNGTKWSGESLLDTRTTRVIYWIALASKPTTSANEIAMIYLDDGPEVHGYVWTGSAWSEMGQTSIWSTSVADSREECIAVAYEQTSGRAMFVWARSTTSSYYYRIWNGTTLTSAATLTMVSSDIGYWLTLKSNPASTSNSLFLTSVTKSSELVTAYWSGSAWTTHSKHSSALDTSSARCADFDWEPTGSKGLLVWGTTAGQIAYKNFTAPSSFGTQQNPTMGSNRHPWVQLRCNLNWTSGDVMILGAVLEDTAFDLGAIKWTGTAFTVIGASTFTAATTVTTYECFDMEFSSRRDPTEFTVDTQFEFSGITGTPTKLEWTIVSKYNASSVSVTIGLYNYVSGWNDTYTYTSSGTADTEETKTIMIVTNVGQYTSGGNAKIHIKAVKSTSTSFQQKSNQILVKYW